MKQYENLQVLAEKAKPLFLQYYKKNKKRLGKMDTIVQQLHDEVSEKIDCLTCANCCRTLGPAIYDKDIERMAKALRIKPSEVVSSYLRIDEDGDYVFKSMPCPFLGPDNLCDIYDVRPKACAAFPHTDRKKIYQINHLTIKNTLFCPAAYLFVEKLKGRI